MLNKIKVAGTVITDLECEETFGTEEIYSFTISVPRPPFFEGSNNFRVRVSNRFNCFKEIKRGSFVEVNGSIRSKYTVNENKKCMLVSIFCSDIKVINELPESVINDGEIEGNVISEPYFIDANNGFPQRCDLLIKSIKNANKYTVVPLTVRGRNAEYMSTFGVGDYIRCNGFLRTRDFRKKIDNEYKRYTAVEFVVRSVELLNNSNNEITSISTSEDISNATCDTN